MSIRKKYSKSTLESAKLYASTKGWKKLSKNRVKFFLSEVKNAKGFVNPQSIKSYSEESFYVVESENKRYKEATLRWAQNNRPDWENITKDRIEEFKDELKDWADERGFQFINSELALDFANESLLPNQVDDFDDTFSDDRIYFTRSMAGWSDPDVVDSFLNAPNFVNASIVDVDNSIIYSGFDRKEFWDNFRDLATKNIFPIYDAYYQTDVYGNVYVTIQVTGYYP